MAKPVVAIVGRPNVGKSTLFNRLIGARHAIVDDSAGVTRDRIYKEADWAGHEFIVVDTGGIITNSNETLAAEVLNQVKLAVTEADVIIFLVDGKAGICGADEDVANLLRRTNKPIILAVNKIDDPKQEMHALEFYGLGLGDPHGLSAMRGTGAVGDLLDKVVALFPGKSRPRQAGAGNGSELALEQMDATPHHAQDDPQSDSQYDIFDDTTPISVAIVGKPNVGKSSMVNALVGDKRAIVGPLPGTTRDAIDSKIKYKAREITIVDTAGIRRKSKVDYGVEAFAVVRALKAIERADVVVLMLDAGEEISDQDQKIAAKIEEAGRAAVAVFNKWDLVEGKSSRLMNEFTENVHSQLRSLSFAEVLFTSALTRQRVPKILDAVERACQETRKRIGTGLLNQIVNESVALVPPPAGKRGKRLKVYYTTQVSVAPPTLVLFVNDDKLMTRQYQVYLERKLRESFGFKGTPIRIVTRAKRENR